MFKRKKKGKFLLKRLVILLAFAVLFSGTLPALAQDEPLAKQLEEAKATIADQAKIIGELRDNFFKTVEGLSEEIERLRVTASQQRVTIDRLKEEVVAIPAVEELRARVAALRTELQEKSALAERLSKRVNLLSGEVANLVSGKAELEATLTEKEKQIQGLVRESQIEIQKLQGEILVYQREIVALEKVNEEQRRTIDQITDNYFKVTGELNAQIEGLEEEIVALEKVNEEQRRTIDQ
ncbi:hypothetical protein IBX65_02765, partial [Candidatus Aerophobetes bacterium]|nr:hypothetical protein [Candidatus Aerophobetes bacterium]